MSPEGSHDGHGGGSERLGIRSVRGLAIRIFVRSLFLETLWNYKGMQNVGFCFCLHPALLKIYSRHDQVRDAMARHLQQVNTHPAMGTMLVGITAKLEQEFDASQVSRYRRSVMTALAARGDRIFWNGFKPLASICSALACLLFLGLATGSFVFLVVYNVPHMCFRAMGFGCGFKKGLALFESRFRKQTDMLLVWMKRLLALALGMTAAAAVMMAIEVPGPTEAGLPLERGMVILGLGFLAFWLLDRGARFAHVLALSSVAAIGLILLTGLGR